MSSRRLNEAPRHEFPRGQLGGGCAEGGMKRSRISNNR